MRADKQAAMFGFLLINVRRLTMLFMAMFIHDMQWLQIQAFILFNFVSLTYQVQVCPYDLRHLNFLNHFNETIGLLASYFLLPLQDVRLDPDQQ